jgi:hypothetical protein
MRKPFLAVKVVLFNSLTKKGILMTLKSTRDMIEKVNISQVMNQCQIVTDADYVYVEKENSQGKIDKDTISSLLPIKNIGITDVTDLNEAYKICNAGLSILHIALTMNSPIDYGICIHVQRSYRGNVTGSQFIIQIVSGGGRTYIREGSGTTSFINYTDWRKI